MKIVIFLVTILIIASCRSDKSALKPEEQQQVSYNYIEDYQFLYNRYFFIDTYYLNRFESAFSEDLLTFSFDEDFLIRELNVYKSIPYQFDEIREGIATLPSRLEEFENVQSVSGIDHEPGEVELSFFIHLKNGEDYEYDYVRGFFYLKALLAENEIIAISYRTDLDTIGTLQSEIIDKDSSIPLVLRLIRPQFSKPEYENLWRLTMRNVYYLGTSNIPKEKFNISIRKKENHETIDKSYNLTYLHLLGLDVIDDEGHIVPGGDQAFDNNFQFFYRSEGLLMFPGIQPFNPLPDSRFQIADSNRANIYLDTTPYPIEHSKFELVVSYLSN